MAENTKKSYVIDASFVLSFLFPDEQVTHVEQVFEKYESGEIALFASPLLPFEVFNGLQSGIYTKRVEPQVVEQLGEKFLRLHIRLEEVTFLEVSKLAILHHLTFYDASYVYLANQKRLPLLTLDKRLKKLAK